MEKNLMGNAKETIARVIPLERIRKFGLTLKLAQKTDEIRQEVSTKHRARRGLESIQAQEGERRERLRWQGRLYGDRVLTRFYNSRTFDDFNSDGDKIGNVFTDFRRFMNNYPDLTYREIGFSEDEITILERKEQLQLFDLGDPLQVGVESNIPGGYLAGEPFAPQDETIKIVKIEGPEPSKENIYS